MKNFCFTFCLLFLLASCSSTTEKNSLAFNNLIGPVKSVTKKAYNAEEKFGEVVKKDAVIGYFSTGVSYENPIIYMEFDDNGYVVSRKEYEQEGVLFRSIECVWENNRLVEQSFYSNDSLTCKIVMEKGDNNLNKGFVNYDGNGHKNSYGEFVVDKDGNEIENKSYDSDGKMTYRIVSDWKNGLLQKQMNYSEYSCTCTENTYKGKQLVSSIMYDSDQGDTIVFLYNEHKDIVSTASGGKYPYIGTYDYMYDEHDNWIKRTSYNNGEVEYIEEREIIYY